MQRPQNRQNINIQSKSVENHQQPIKRYNCKTKCAANQRTNHFTTKFTYSSHCISLSVSISLSLSLWLDFSQNLHLTTSVVLCPVCPIAFSALRSTPNYSVFSPLKQHIEIHLYFEPVFPRGIANTNLRAYQLPCASACANLCNNFLQ